MSSPFEINEPRALSVPWVRNRTAFVWLFAIMGCLTGLPWPTRLIRLTMANDGKSHRGIDTRLTLHHLTSFHVIHLKGASNEDPGNHGSARTGRSFKRDLRCN